MASSSGESDSVSTVLVCPKCGQTVDTATHGKRTICPFCGSFYDQRANDSIQFRQRLRKGSSPLPLPAVEEKKKTGPMRSLRKFFSNMSKPKSKSKLPQPEPEMELRSSSSLSPLPPISPRGGSTSPGVARASEDGPSPALPAPPPVIFADASELRAAVEQARESTDWTTVAGFISYTFHSVDALNQVFRAKRDEKMRFLNLPKNRAELDVDRGYLDDFNALLPLMSKEVHKCLLKSIVNHLLDERKKPSDEDVRAYFVLLQLPLFESATTFPILAHVLRQVSSLPAAMHHILVDWLSSLGAEQFYAIVRRLQTLVSHRLFPPRPEELPPLARSAWWIPSAVRVLSLFNAANNSAPKVPFSRFYVHSLDHIDLMAEYTSWQDPGTRLRFCFCQFPFVLSIAAKRTILQHDSEHQMIRMARTQLVNQVQQRQMPDLDSLFLMLKVRRSHLVSDSLNEIALKQRELKKKLRVTFLGEPGFDMGGPTKEWFLLLVRKIFRPEYGMFLLNKASGYYWFTTGVTDNLQEFHLVGVLMGLAVYNSIILDISFPPCCFKKLLSPAVVPARRNDAVLGVAPLSVDDLVVAMPDLGRGLKELRDYEGSVEDDFGLTFQINVTELSATRTYPLKPGGEAIAVTNLNREEYIHLHADFLLNKLIYEQFKAFYLGFHSVCASNALILLRPEEIEMLVCGSSELDMKELKKITHYDGYKPDDPVIQNFWDIVCGWKKSLQKRLLLFATGSDRIPVGGMSELGFKICRVEPKNDMLPMSHTCFNQLILPAYRNRKTLKNKLQIAIQNAEGFGIE